jgi:hypothetical protein
LGLIGLLLFLGGLGCLIAQLVCAGYMHPRRWPVGRVGQTWIAASVGATPVLWLLLNCAISLFYAPQASAVPFIDAFDGGILLVPFLIVASFAVASAVSSRDFGGSQLVHTTVRTAQMICLWYAISTVLRGVGFLAVFPFLSMANYLLFLRFIPRSSSDDAQPAPAWFKPLWFGSLIAIIAIKPFADSAIDQMIRGMLSI